MGTSEILTTMTAAQAKAEAGRFAKEVGGDATVYLNFGSEKALQLSVYPKGIGRGECELRFDADDFDSLISGARARWDEVRAAHAKRRTRDMALEIIRATADRGSCTESDLRMARFTQDDLKRYGALAIADANAMAAGGPFSIIGGALSNAINGEGAAAVGGFGIIAAAAMVWLASPAPAEAAELGRALASYSLTEAQLTWLAGMMILMGWSLRSLFDLAVSGWRWFQFGRA